jgi:hypothetical protein
MLILLLTLALVECGGGSSSTNMPSGGNNNNNGWVLIRNESTEATGASIGLYGIAFADTPTSYDYDNCPLGLDTSMTLRWINNTSGASGYGYLGYWVTAYYICEHRWSATVPLIPGNNEIVITVSGGTETGTASTNIHSSLFVTSTSPLAGAINVPVTSAISATLNGQIDAQSATPSSFQVLGGNSAHIGGALALSGSTVTFMPDNFLNNGWTYTATITTAMKDINGVAIAQNYLWRFTVESPYTYKDIVLPYWGESNLGDSYYRVSGMVPTTTYNVLVYSLDDLKSLYVTMYNKSDFNVATCHVYLVGYIGGNCMATPDDAGYLWIKVSDVSLWNTVGAFSLSLQ